MAYVYARVLLVVAGLATPTFAVSQNPDPDIYNQWYGQDLFVCGEYRLSKRRELTPEGFRGTAFIAKIGERIIFYALPAGDDSQKYTSAGWYNSTGEWQTIENPSSQEADSLLNKAIEENRGPSQGRLENCMEELIKILPDT